MREELIGPKGKPVLLVDLDGVCADLARKWLAEYNRDWNDDLTLDRIVEWEWHRFVKPQCGTRVYHYLSRPGFFADLEPVPGAIETLAALQEQVEIVIVTASPRPAMGDKVRWVRRHLPFIPRENVVLTYRKDLVRGDFILDDAPRNLRHFQGVRILMDYPYNRTFHEAWRVRHWAEAADLIRRLVTEIQAGAAPLPWPQSRLRIH